MEAVAGIEVMGDKIAKLYVALFELNVSMRLSLALHRDRLIAGGLSKTQIDSTLSQAEKEIRGQMLEALKAENQSAGEKQQQRGDSDISGQN